MNAPEVIIRNEKRMLQQAVDALFDNGRCRRPVLRFIEPSAEITDRHDQGEAGPVPRKICSASASTTRPGRSSSSGPELKLHQCGLPKKIALELYQPFIIRRLKEHGLADTIKSAKKMLERRDPEVWDILEECIYQHPVMLNRATRDAASHGHSGRSSRCSSKGNAIKIHPLVCKGFKCRLRR